MVSEKGYKKAIKVLKENEDILSEITGVCMSETLTALIKAQKPNTPLNLLLSYSAVGMAIVQEVLEKGRNSVFKNEPDEIYKKHVEMVDILVHTSAFALQKSAMIDKDEDIKKFMDEHEKELKEILDKKE